VIVLVTGGTGTLAQHLLPMLLADPRIERIRCLSRGEHKQMELAEKYAKERIDFFLGDVRDRERVLLASEGCQQIYHLAAHKGVDSAEYNVTEVTATNILGTHNVITAARQNGVERVMFTSSDKACEPINIYGGTKLVAEKMTIQANIGRHRTRYSACRYGNVLASNGSVVQKWREGWNLMTYPSMTRFFISPHNAAAFVHRAMTEMEGAEVFIPKMKSTTMRDLWDAVCPGKTFAEVGKRPGEKDDECLISKHEVSEVTDIGWAFVRWPEFKLFPSLRKGKPIPYLSGYTSRLAERFTKLELEDLCRS
jgi:UDP-N-acetylglucosamine 4,6-dehydratase/5-epimerase